MSIESDRRHSDDVKGYQDTVARLEPEIHPIDASAYYASAAISLKRIADGLDQLNANLEKPRNRYGDDVLTAIADVTSILRDR